MLRKRNDASSRQSSYSLKVPVARSVLETPDFRFISASCTRARIRQSSWRMLPAGVLRETDQSKGQEGESDKERMGERDKTNLSVRPISFGIADG
ncbi:unnamed protein product [Protopolystoma xenopodis]|uniref:Uncharacterized protein n=1 Tax=Protopolystoma xenopodis TaxID=117903 RepID=A0A448WVK7_9PLAT|nr:unnamed protein product [Protopolystoma xenopodis]